MGMPHHIDPVVLIVDREVAGFRVDIAGCLQMEAGTCDSLEKTHSCLSAPDVKSLP